MNFSWKEREAALQSLSARPTELLVIGGGVVGCSIAAHAALLGLDCILIERADFASGASGNSTGLAHAGLRYLAQGRVRYVLHEARERLRLEKLAPQWVRPFSFLFPVYQGDPFGLTSIRLGTALYDGLYRFAARSLHPRQIGQHYRMVKRQELLERIPGLSPVGLKGGTEYFVDARLSDCRFTLGFAQKAAAEGARVLTYVSLQSFLHGTDGLVGALLRDAVSGQRFQVKARLLINATGAWIDSVRALAGLKNPLLQNSKGIHLIVDRLAESPLILSTRVRGQVFFVIPIGSALSLVGTTDSPYSGDPDQAKPTNRDVAELIENLFRFFPSQRPPLPTLEESVLSYRKEHVHEMYWGLRPLAGEGPSTVHASREHRLVKEANGLWSVPGVKLTAGRAVGEHVAQQAWTYLKGTPVPGKTLAFLPGGDFTDFPSYVQEAQKRSPAYSEETLNYLIGRYGTRYGDVLAWAEKESRFRERVLPDEDWLYAEVPYAAHQELVLTLNDFLWRRTRWARLRDLPEEVLQKIARLLGGYLNWSDEKIEKEVAGFRNELSAHRLP